MRCDCCPLSDPEDTCPEAEGEYGIEHKDGVCGCRHPWNWAYKREMVFAKGLLSISAKKCSGKTETRVQTSLHMEEGKNNG